ncbi:hypothetical protein JNN96_15840 [Mycobacterium sp. DSM 3803]|nr:hypothetical protein [Mycobacterium sp. DSM 3803]
MTGSGTEVRESFRRMKWWHWVLTVLMAVGVFFGIQWILKSSDDDTHPLSAVAYQGQVGVPGQVLLPPMQRQPVPGWRVDLRQLFPDVVRPTIEHVGDNGNRAFFSVSYNVRATGQPKSWLLGIDATTGATLFAPVEIEKPVVVNCLPNGPQRVLCLNEAGGPGAVTAWVIDTDAGTVISHAASNLRTTGIDPAAAVVRSAGDRVIAFQPGTGWRGVDDQGQLTWTVKAAGDSIKVLDRRPGDPVTDIAVTAINDKESVAFSTVDGTVLRKSGGTLTPVVGGFVELERQSAAVSRSPEEFAFFDARGTRVGRYTDQTGGPSLFEGSELPVLTLSLTDQLVVLDPKGTPMTVVPADSPWSVRIVGESVYTRGTFTDIDNANAVWEKFALKTGDHVSSCTGAPLEDGAFVGSDGTVAVGRLDDKAPIIAVDTNTCEVVWQIESPAPTWMIGSTLVQAKRDTYEIASLVPPAA